MAPSPDATQPRAAFVTGGASGIGLAVVRALSAQGWQVHVADADVSALDSLRPWAGAQGDAVTLVELDVCDDTAVSTAVAAVGSALRGVVNSAGIGQSMAFMDTGIEIFRRILDVNLLGTFRVGQAAARAMAAYGGGAIVNISSGSGLRANEGRAAYGSSKAAVEMLSKVMAVELAAQGIRVNTVAPGPIETPLVSGMHTEADRRRAVAAVPMRRYGRPEDVARAVLFLLDSSGAGYVTGETLCVDGGFFAAGQFG